MNIYDRELAETYSAWAHYGIPPERDIAERFGIDHHRALRILDDLIDRHVGVNLEAINRTILQKLVKNMPVIRNSIASHADSFHSTGERMTFRSDSEEIHYVQSRKPRHW